MEIAINENGERIYAKDGKPKCECFCQGCGKKVGFERSHYRLGNPVNAFFKHYPGTDCGYDHRDGDSNNKGEWHRKMQDLFPIECQEWCFTDEETKERHIADVYVKERNTVIEFQHSPISAEEIEKRTAFHINNGRRIVWVFDERSNKQKENQIGNFRLEEKNALYTLVVDGINFHRNYRVLEWIKLRDISVETEKLWREYQSNFTILFDVSTNEIIDTKKVLLSSQGFNEVAISGVTFDEEKIKRIDDLFLNEADISLRYDIDFINWVNVEKEKIRQPSQKIIYQTTLPHNPNRVREFQEGLKNLGGNNKTGNHYRGNYGRPRTKRK